MKRVYMKACSACIKCRSAQPLATQAVCNDNCETCALGTTMPANGLVSSGGNNGNGGTNPYGMDFETGVATISCYDIIGSGGTNKCGSSLAYAETIPGIDFDAAFPLAYWPKAVYGNCDECEVSCSGSWGPSSVLQYDGQPLCYNITSRSTSAVKTIRVVDSCGR